jgi:hypothetical protein
MKEHHATIEISLEASNKDIKNNLLALTKELQKILLVVAELDQAMEKLKADIVAKSGAMVIDKACMENLVTTGSTASSASAATAAIPRSPRKADVMAPSPRKSNQDDWMSKGSAVAVSALHVLEKCAPIKRSATSLLAEIREGGRLQRDPAVLDAFRNQAKCGDHLDNQLDLNKKAMQNQIQSLAKQETALQISLEKTLHSQSEVNQKTTALAKQCLEVKLPPISSPRKSEDVTPRRSGW